MSQPRTIALFGGSFNPPHVAHQMVCLLVLETCEVDELWMLPTYHHPFAKHLAPFEDRFRMCELAAAALGPRVRVSRIEAELDQQVSRTLYTLRALLERHPADRFRLVIGTDILTETEKWCRWDEIVALAPPIVIGRAGYDMAMVDHDDESLSVELPRISSTVIRERLSSGQSALPLVPRLVMNYIAERGLYR